MFVTKCVRTPLEDWASDFTCHKLHWELFNISRPTTGIDLCHKHISIVKSVVSSELCRGCAGEAEVEGSTKVEGGAETVEGEAKVL